MHTPEVSGDDPNPWATPAPATRAGTSDRRSRLLLQVARRILGTSELRDVVESALSACAALVPASRRGVGLIDESEGTYRVYAIHGLPREEQPQIAFPLGAFRANIDLLRRGEVDQRDDLGADPHGLSRVLATEGLRSLLVVPIVDGGVLVGTLNVGSEHPGAFGDDHVDAAEEIADLVRQALQQLDFQRELSEAHRAALLASKAKSAFLANTSHELRTPLNAIIGYAELVDEQLADLGAREVREDVAKIRKAATHLLGLINEVLDLAKIEAGKLEFHVNPVSMPELLHDVSEAVSPLVARGGNRWVVEPDPTIASVATDRVRVVQILYNLIGNAAKFCRNGQIGLTIRHDHAYVEFAVWDTGIGIRAEKLPTLFDAFTQAHATQGEDFGGTGLGLAICKRYAEKLGGDITVESSVGKGTTFRVRLPRQG